MKLAFSLIAVILTGCAIPPHTSYHQVTSINNEITLAQLERIQLSNADCNAIDQRIAYFEKQLQLHGTWGHNPEELSEADRRYNSAGKVAIWSLRIGCNNPDRYR
jgi:hypothetical protein